MIPPVPASSLIPGQKSLSFRRQLQGSSGRSEGFASAGADTGNGPGLGGEGYLGGGRVGAIGRASGALGAGGGIAEDPEATPSVLGSIPAVEGADMGD